jgi:hypothetical protein
MVAFGAHSNMPTRPGSPQYTPLLSDEACYGADFKAHLLEQYRLYVEMAYQVSERRDKTNAFFLSIHTALLTTMALVLSNREWMLLAIAPSFPALVLCYFWRRSIESYRLLNSAKFRVIHELEKGLAGAPYAYEWERELQGQGEESKKYRPMTDLEQHIPVVFALLYVAIGLLVVFSPPVAKQPNQVELSGRLFVDGSPPVSAPGAPSVPRPSRQEQEGQHHDEKAR